MLFSKKLAIFMLVGLLLLGTVVNMGIAQEESETVGVAGIDVIETTIPYESTGAGFSIPAQFFYDGLCRINPDTNEPEPSVAKDWDVSEDGLTYTFYLREGVQWHNGYGELTAEDVVFTFERHVDPEEKSVHKDTFWMVDEVEAVDDYTVKFHLNAPFGGFIYSVTLMHPGWGALVCKDAWEKLGQDGYKQDPVGCGPYMWIDEEYVPREVAIFEAFEDYFRGKPEIDRIEYNITSDMSTRCLAVESGDADLTQITRADLFSDTKDREGVVGFALSPPCVWKLDLNTQNPPLDKVEVRKAIAHAIDTEAINEILFGGHSIRPNCSLLHPNMANVNSELFEPREQDFAKVNSLLAEVGLKPADVEAELVTLTKYSKQADILVSMFRAAGLHNLDIIPMERGAYSERTMSSDNDGAFVGHCRWPDPDPLLTVIHGDSIPPDGHNLTWWDEADELIDKSRRTTGEERTETITEIQHLLCEEVPNIPIYHGAAFWLASERLRGIRPSNNNFRPWEWYTEQN